MSKPQKNSQATNEPVTPDVSGETVVDPAPTTTETPEAPTEPEAPTTGFSTIRSKVAERTKSEVVVLGANEIAQVIANDVGVDVLDESVSPVIRNIYTDMNEYVRYMAPTSPIDDRVGYKFQVNLLHRINDALNAEEVAVGVTALKVLAVYFKHYRAFEGTLPFRYFNLVNSGLQQLSDVVYTIQAVSRDGAIGAKNISMPKLKASCPSESAQIVILQFVASYKEQ